MTFLKIANGTVYDPANNIDGVVQDIWIQDGKVIPAPMAPDVHPDKVIDATGLVVMPGGVDMHAHIAGPKVNVARKMRPEDKRKAPVIRRTPLTRSGTTGSVPSTFATGYLYAGMGYTTAFDAAIPPLSARHAHEEFHDTPVIDKGFFLLFGNNHYVMKQIAANEPEKLRAFVGWLLAAAKDFDARPRLAVEVGQVLVGSPTSLTGAGPLGYYLHKVTGRKWANADTEMEAGCGIVPITYKEKSFVHALQWAIGLEWYLLANDPWRVAMSTDHPNGGSFLAYPEIVQLLMDRTYRQDVLKRVHPRVLRRSTLKDLDREYSLYEIAIITRAAPARMLGLKQKGHLGVGADADVTIYTPGADRRAMFELPRYVIKGGEVVVEQGEIRREVEGRSLYVA